MVIHVEKIRFHDGLTNHLFISPITPNGESQKIGPNKLTSGTEIFLQDTQGNIYSCTVRTFMMGTLFVKGNAPTPFDAIQAETTPIT